MDTQVPSHNASKELDALLEEYELPSSLGFGKEIAPVMYGAEFCDGRWQRGQLLPFGDILVNPAATALQFAQQAFEGMKAYQVTQSSPVFFRPEMNFRRLNRSAERLSMPALTPEVFAETLTEMAGACQTFIPGKSGQSLYLRPTLIGTDPSFAVKSSERFSFWLIASPSDAYYGKPIKVMIEREDCRAAVGGTGANKVGGNYAASLQATQKCIDAGFDQPIWLDPKSRKNIEELSGMNFIAVIDGILHTPLLSGSILPGVTRDSLMQLAAQLGIEVVERTMGIDELLDDISAGRCSELFSCGTAAIVCPIAAIGESDGTVLKPAYVNRTAKHLKTALLDIQEGRATDTFSWMADALDREQLLSRFNES